MWRIAADTGGTFTDCHGLAPDGAEHRVKVLSSGCLRSSILAIPSEHEISLAVGQVDYLTNFERKFRLQGRPIYRASYEK